jgi:hypothetical protein
MSRFLAFSAILWFGNLSWAVSVALAQSGTTFTQNGVTYAVTVDRDRGQNRVFTLSHQQPDRNTHTLKYRGTCGTNTVDIVQETIANPEGKILSQETAEEAIAYSLSPDSDFEYSAPIRQALQMICQNQLDN